MVTDEERNLLHATATTTITNRKLGEDILDQSILTEFKHLHQLKDDAVFDFQVIDDSHTFSAKGKKYSLDGLEPVKVYTDDATLMMDGKVLSEKPHDYDLHVFTGTDGSDTIMVSTKEGANGKQEIDTIHVLGADGSPDVHLVTVLPGLLTTIRPEDIIDASKDNVKFDSDDQDGKEIGSFLDGSDNDIYNLKNNFGGRKMLRKSKKQQETNRELQSTGCSSFEVIEMAIAFDSTFCAKDGGGSFSLAKQEAENIVAQASVFYQRQGVCGKIKIKHLEGNCNASSDPNRYILSNVGTCRALAHFRRFWLKNRSSISCDSAHLFFNEKKGSTMGCAWSGDVLCYIDRKYGVNDMSKLSSNTFGKAILFAHELGHNAGLGHTNGRNSIMRAYSKRNTITAPEWSSKSVSGLKSNLPKFSCLATENNTSKKWMQLQTNGLCADLQDWKNAIDGMRIVLKPCRSSRAQSQQWNYDNLGRFVNRHTGKCMSVGRKGNLHDKAFIWSCSSSKMYYQWDKLSNGKYRNKQHSNYYLGVAHCGDESKVGYLELRSLNTSGACNCSQTWNKSSGNSKCS